MSFGWDDVTAYGLGLAGAELGTSYRQPALKVKGNSFASTGHDAETSFVLHLPLDTVEMALTVAPEIFYQTPHYIGWPSVLVRYDADFAEVEPWIERAHEAAAAKPKRKPR